MRVPGSTLEPLGLDQGVSLGQASGCSAVKWEQ